MTRDEVINNIDTIHDPKKSKKLNLALDKYFETDFKLNDDPDLFIDHLRKSLLDHFSKEADAAGIELIKAMNKSGFKWFTSFIEFPQDKDKLYPLLATLMMYCIINEFKLTRPSNKYLFLHNLVLKIFTTFIEKDPLFAHEIFSICINMPDVETAEYDSFSLLDALYSMDLIEYSEFFYSFIRNKDKRQSLTGYLHYFAVERILINIVNVGTSDLIENTPSQFSLLSEDTRFMNFICHFLVENFFEVDSIDALYNSMNLFFFLRSILFERKNLMESRLINDSEEYLSEDTITIISKLDLAEKNLSKFGDLYMDEERISLIFRQITTDILKAKDIARKSKRVLFKSEGNNIEVGMCDMTLFLQNFPIDCLEQLCVQPEFVDILISKIDPRTFDSDFYVKVFNKLCKVSTYRVSQPNVKRDIEIKLKKLFANLLRRKYKQYYLADIELFETLKILKHIGHDVLIDHVGSEDFTGVLNIIVKQIQNYSNIFLSLGRGQLKNDIRNQITKLLTNIGLYNKEWMEKQSRMGVGIIPFNLPFYANLQKLGLLIIRDFIEIHSKVSNRDNEEQ